MKITALVTAIIAAAMAFSFREPLAGTHTMWLGLVVPYALLSAFTLYRMYDDGTLLDALAFRAGDVTIGAATAGALFGGAYAIRKVFLAGITPHSAWLFHIALELGTLKPSPALFGVVTILAILEEIVWRGLVLTALTADLGTRRAWPLAAVAYAVAHIPTVFTLADPNAGPNPLLLLAALGCGLVWSFVASLLGRLPPAIVSHAVFSYFAIAVLLPRFG